MRLAFFSDLLLCFCVTKMGVFMVAALRTFRDSFLSTEERKERERMIAILNLVKIATTVMVVVTALLAVAAPSVYAASILGLVACIGHETFQVAHNVKEIYENPVVETASRINQENLSTQVTKSAPLVQAIIVLCRLDIPRSILP